MPRTLRAGVVGEHGTVTVVLLDEHDRRHVRRVPDTVNGYLTLCPLLIADAGLDAVQIVVADRTTVRELLIRAGRNVVTGTPGLLRALEHEEPELRAQGLIDASRWDPVDDRRPGGSTGGPVDSLLHEHIAASWHRRRIAGDLVSVVAPRPLLERLDAAPGGLIEQFAAWLTDPGESAGPDTGPIWYWQDVGSIRYWQDRLDLTDQWSPVIAEIRRTVGAAPTVRPLVTDLADSFRAADRLVGELAARISRELTYGGRSAAPPYEERPEPPDREGDDASAAADPDTDPWWPDDEMARPPGTTASEPPIVQGGRATQSARPPRDAAPPGDTDRQLLAQVPSQAPNGAELSLVVRIAADPADVAHTVRAGLAGLTVGPAGADVTVVVQAPRALRPDGPLQAVVHVPPTGDSDPVRFGFRAREVGLHRLHVNAWAGGTFLGELVAEVAVTADGPYGAEAAHTADLTEVAPRPGEVTLQVTTDGRQYAFQLLSDQTIFEPVPAAALGQTPDVAVEQALAELRRQAVGSTGYRRATARRWLREIGVGLWNDLVPGVLREQFWQIHDQMTSFSIATGNDAVPWELLYPLAPGHDDGFLVEQLPVLRRTYGQRRARTITMDGARFVVPPGSPRNADDEVAALRALVRADDRPAIGGLDELLALIDSGDAGALHFACHNTFDGGGSAIMMDGGSFVPPLLNSARTTVPLRGRSPLVFINACRSAGAVPQYTRMMGWAQQFMAAGAGAFVGTLWAVRSDTSTRFAEQFYGRLAAGETLGAASQGARLHTDGDEIDPTWLAYTVYGDPAATAAGRTLPEGTT